MKRPLPSTLHYRLRMLDGRARFYKVDATMRRLERLGLVKATGQHDPDGERAEYAITEAGQTALLGPAPADDQN